MSAETPTHKRMAGVLHVERRRSARYGVRLRVLFPWGDRILQAHTMDLSETGMQIESLADLGRGTRLVMHFAPSGERVTQRVEGEVMWVKPPRDGGALYACGVRFLAVSEEAQASIRAILREKGDDLPEVGLDDVVELEDTRPPEAARIATELHQAVHVDQGRHAERRREADALVIEAKHAAESGGLSKAIQLLEQALKLAPDSQDAMEELARVLYLKGDVARAAELFDRALRIVQESSG